MGYGGTTFLILADLRRRGVLSDVHSVMDVGAQEAWDGGNPPYCTGFLKAFGGADVSPAEVAALLEKRYVKYLWERVGVKYHSIECDAQFDSLMLDLNFDDVPPEYRGRYDLVTNCGTTEHVINQYNSFRVIHDLTRVGGYMYHDLPWSGMTNHGFVNYKPGLFHNLARSNYYQVAGLWLRAQVNDPTPLPADIVAHCTDKGAEFYTQYAEHHGGIAVLLRKTQDIPFVPPLDVEPNMVFPDQRARERYWTIADPHAQQQIEAYRRDGFPNVKADDLRARCRALEAELAGREAQLARMEASAFWKARKVLARCKRAVLGRRAAA